VTDVELLLSSTLRERASEAPQPQALADEARLVAHGIRRRRWLAVAASAAAVVVVVAGTAFALGRRAAPEPAGPAPAGWQAVSSLGIQVAVPSSWHVVNDVTCAPYRGPSVVRGGGFRTDCRRLPSTTETVVTIAPAPHGSSTEPDGLSGLVGIALGHVDERPSLGGVPAELERGRQSDGRHYVLLLVPSRDVVVYAVGPEAALLDRVVRTARLVDVDWVGCPTRPPARPSWDEPRSGPAVDPGSPSSISVCSYGGYGGNRMAASTRLRGAAAAEVAAAIRAARPGPVPSTMACSAVPDADLLVLVLHAAGRPDDVVRVHYAHCQGAYLVSASGVSQVTQRLLVAVFLQLHAGSGWSGSLPKG
jgi:hypothetical protein